MAIRRKTIIFGGFMQKDVSGNVYRRVHLLRRHYGTPTGRQLWYCVAGVRIRRLPGVRSGIIARRSHPQTLARNHPHQHIFRLSPSPYRNRVQARALYGLPPVIIVSVVPRVYHSVHVQAPPAPQAASFRLLSCFYTHSPPREFRKR